MKLLVNIFVPAISERYDIWVPPLLRIKTVSSMLAEIVEQLSNHRYIKSGDERLCSVEKEITLRESANLKQYGIRNGDHLILM